MEERAALVVADRLAVELDPITPPVGHRRVAAACRFGCRPLGEEHRRRRVVPAQAAVGEAGLARAHGLADREVHLVVGDLELALAHPELQETGIEIHERRSPKQLERPRRRVVGEVEHEVRLGRDGLDAGTAVHEPRVELRAVEARQGECPAQAVGLEPSAESGDVTLDVGPRPRRGVLADVLEPDDAATQRTQRKRPVEVDPEMTAALWVTERERGDADSRRHGWNVARRCAGHGSPG